MSAANFDHFIVTGKTFRIDTVPKPETRNARVGLKSLKKIEYILKNNLSYDPYSSDGYSKMSNEALVRKLQTRAQYIKNHYLAKTAGKSWIAKLFGGIYSEEKKVKSTFQRIENIATSLLPPARIFPMLPPELTTRFVMRFLSTRDIGRLGGMNVDGSQNARTAHVFKARVYGYVGNDFSEASEFLQSRFRAAKELVNDPKFPFKLGEQITGDCQEAYKFIFDNKTHADLLKFINEKFYQAVKGSSVEKAKKLLALGIAVDVNYKPADQTNSPLLQAIQVENNEMIELLLSKGASLTFSDQNRVNILMHAVHTQNVKLIEYILKDPIGRTTINQQDNNGYTALHYAAIKGGKNQETMIRLLLAAGVDKTIRDSRNKTAFSHVLDFNIRSLFKN